MLAARVLDISPPPGSVRAALPSRGIEGMKGLEFSELLTGYMRRIRATASGVATEIGMSREAVNNWRHGYSQPNRKHRDKLLACARYLRLTESETNALLTAGGFEPEYLLAEAAGSGPYADTIAGLYTRLSQLSPYPILMLLSQAHWGQPPFREALLAKARAVYGSDAVLHIQPPYSVSAEAPDYFQAIGAQCGFEGVDSDFGFEAALERRLAGGETVFCLVSRFEQGVPALREQLAGILRSLSEMYSGRLHLLLCGGAALADLKYQGGDLSLLNIANVVFWPEMDATQVSAIATQTGKPLTQPQQAARLLALTGGHPALLQEALGLITDDPSLDDAALNDALAASPRIWQAVLPLLEDPARRARLAQWLDAADLGRARPYLLDADLRRLFWDNLIAPRTGADGPMLHWRCPAVRQALRGLIDQCAAS